MEPIESTIESTIENVRILDDGNEEHTKTTITVNADGIQSTVTECYTKPSDEKMKELVMNAFLNGGHAQTQIQNSHRKEFQDVHEVSLNACLQ